MLMDTIIVVLLITILVLIATKRALKFEIRHIHESVVRTFYVDETPTPSQPAPLTQEEADKMDEFYKSQSDPMKDIMNMIHDMGGKDGR